MKVWHYHPERDSGGPHLTVTRIGEEPEQLQIQATVPVYDGEMRYWDWLFHAMSRDPFRTPTWAEREREAVRARSLRGRAGAARNRWHDWHTSLRARLAYRIYPEGGYENDW